MTVEVLMRNMIARGVIFEPVGDKLRVDPVERLNPGELETIRQFKSTILSLFASGRLELVPCPGDGCRERLVVMDGLTYCNRHRMTIRFVATRQ